MKKKTKPGAIQQLLSYAGNNKKQLYLSTFLATLGELFGMAPFITVSLLVAELFNKTATIQNVCILFAVALGGQILKLWLTYQSSFMSHKATYKILKNIRSKIADKMLRVPMGIMLDTPTGNFKNLMADTVSKLEDSMAHFMPEITSNVVAPLLSLCALVIYILCAFLSFSPYTMLVVSPLWSLLAAITYFLVAAKTKKPWTLFIFCAITGIYGFYPPMIICCIIAGIISALIAWKTGCTNGKTLTISYIIYMVLAAFSGTYIPFLFFSNQTLEQYAGMFGESYLGILQTLVSPVTAIIMLVVVAICAFVGALNAKKLLKKHFKKAGMV